MAKKIFVAGHNGMVGAALVRALDRQDVELITADRHELDLTRQDQVEAFFAAQKIDEVYLAAAKVGGIHANNTYPADFIHTNLMIECNVIGAAHAAGVERLLFLGSSCIYPRMADQPIAESALLGGPLEPTNEPYAVAKIAGIKVCESFNRQYHCDFRSVMPTNLYGPGDNFHPTDSHVIPALIQRFHEAKVTGAERVAVWGSGQARREFLHVDDMAAACVHVMSLERHLYAACISDMQSHINVGTGQDCSIRELAETIASVVGFAGRLEFDRSKADGAPRKLLNVDLLIELEWQARIDLRTGLSQTYAWFLQHLKTVRGQDTTATERVPGTVD